MTTNWRTHAVALTIAGSIVAGIGAYTFSYGEGLSYFSTDPRACANCHIMQPQFDAWQKASHHIVATCVDCHLPAALLPKYLAKASNGWYHSKGFTLQDFAEPIRIKPSNSAILQDNCLRCHGALTHGMLTSATTDPDPLYCVHCHSSVGHGQSAGLGGPLLRSEQLPASPSDTSQGPVP